MRKEAQKGERAMLLVLRRFRELVDENYRSERYWRWHMERGRQKLSEYGVEEDYEGGFWMGE